MGEHVAEHEQADPAIIVAVRGEHLLDAVFRSEVNCTGTGGSLEVVFRKEGSQVWNGAKDLKYVYVKKQHKNECPNININEDVTKANR